MKSVIVPNPKSDAFEPITVQLTFESHNELLAFLTRLDLPHHNVRQSIDESEAFFAYGTDYASVPQRINAENSGAIMHIWKAVGVLMEHCGKYK